MELCIKRWTCKLVCFSLFSEVSLTNVDFVNLEEEQYISPFHLYEKFMSSMKIDECSFVNADQSHIKSTGTKIEISNSSFKSMFLNKTN